MLLLALMIAIQTPTWTPEQAIAAVRDGHLTFNKGRSVGKTFEINPWLESATWEAELKADHALVHVTLPLDDVRALREYMEKNQYAFRKNFMAMQLEPVYGLVGERSGVNLMFTFKVYPDSTFETLSGHIDVRHQADQQWHRKALVNKAIVEILRGIYARENPYESFIRGLPFK